MSQKTNNRFIIIAGRGQIFMAGHLFVETGSVLLFNSALPADAQHEYFLHGGDGLDGV